MRYWKLRMRSRYRRIWTTKKNSKHLKAVSWQNSKLHKIRYQSTRPKTTNKLKILKHWMMKKVSWRILWVKWMKKKLEIHFNSLRHKRIWIRWQWSTTRSTRNWKRRKIKLKLNSRKWQTNSKHSRKSISLLKMAKKSRLIIWHNSIRISWRQKMIRYQSFHLLIRVDLHHIHKVKILKSFNSFSRMLKQRSLI